MILIKRANYIAKRAFHNHTLIIIKFNNLSSNNKWVKNNGCLKL